MTMGAKPPDDTLGFRRDILCRQVAVFLGVPFRRQCGKVKSVLP